MNRDDYVDLIKSTALDLGSKFVMQYLVAKLPFLALPVINPIAGFLVGYVLKIAIRETEMGAFFLYIDTRTNKQGIAFVEAAQRNKAMQAAGTPEERANAEKDLIDSFRAFVRFDT
jgi:hypothetical protein